VAGPSENGQNDLVVVYHGDGTFDLFSSSRGYGGAGKNKGVWWWGKDGKFCFKLDGGTDAGKDQCKSNGHLIGRVDANGRAVPSVEPAQAQVRPAVNASRKPPTGPFDGMWAGVWGGADRATLSIKQIGPGEAEVTYTYGGNAPSPLKNRVAISGNQFGWSSRNGATMFSFNLNSDGSLTGRRSEVTTTGSPGHNAITMQRQQ